MNASSLVGIVQGRIPGYETQEYLRELNTCYQRCWDEILQLDDSYFTDIKVVTVGTQAAEFDFLFNSNGNLVATVSNRYFQIDRIRILQQNDNCWVPALPRGWNDPEFLSMQAQTPAQVQITGPYRYSLFAKGSCLFARPLPAGTQIEVTYSFIYVPLTIINNGTVTNSASAVTGTATNFTTILGADYQAGLPGNDEDTDVGIELILPGGNQTYRVKTVTSNTALTTVNAISPAVTASQFSIAIVPDIPEGHHEVIATMATHRMSLTPARDFVLAGAMRDLAKEQMESMKDSIMTRQRQEPPRRRRFSQSAILQQGYSVSR